MNIPLQTKEDRGTLAKESAAALTTEPLEKGTIMTNSTDLPARGARVVHIGTQELGTVIALSEDHDELGELATVRWDNPDALELPRFLHTKHLEVVVDIEAVRDDELVAECRRRGLPGTVTELVQEAERQGVEPSELLERLDGSYDFAKAASILTEEGLL